MVAESGNFPAIARFYAEEVVLKGMALIRGVLARGIERGEFRPIDLDGALPLFSAPMLLLLLWKHSLGRHTDIQFNPRAGGRDPSRHPAARPGRGPAAMKRRLVLVAVLVALAIGGGLWWQSIEAPPPGWQGYVDADYVRVGPTLGGQLVSLSVHRGDQVAAGATLFAQDDTDDCAARDQAAATLAEAQDRLTNLEKPAARPRSPRLRPIWWTCAPPRTASPRTSPATSNCCAAARPRSRPSISKAPTWIRPSPT